MCVFFFKQRTAHDMRHSDWSSDVCSSDLEFAILCRGLDGVDAAERLAARLVDDVAQPMIVDGIELRVGLSVGMAPLQDGDDPIDLLGRADDALRTAKIARQRRRPPAASHPASHPSTPSPRI